jgi:hypothetical protein
MTTLRTCSNLAEAQLLKALLEESGVAAFVPDELTANAAPQLLFAAGIRLQVEDEDVNEANQIIATAETSAEADDEDAPDSKR